MEIRRNMNKKIILIVVLSFMLGTIVSQIPLYIYIDAQNCNNIPTFHILYLRQIKDCLHQEDINLSQRLDATNSVFFNEIQRLDLKIDNATKR